jgi:hypothetical protein
VSQSKRRVHKINAIRAPATGRPDSRFRYPLGARLQKPPHIGHRQILAATLIPTTKPPSFFVALSTTNPRGRSEMSNPYMAPTPCPNQSQIGASNSSKLSESHFSTLDHNAKRPAAKTETGMNFAFNPGALAKCRRHQDLKSDSFHEA